MSYCYCTMGQRKPVPPKPVPPSRLYLIDRSIHRDWCCRHGERDWDHNSCPGYTPSWKTQSKYKEGASHEGKYNVKSPEHLIYLELFLPYESTFENRRYKSHLSPEINVLIMGRSQAGKSSLLLTLLNPQNSLPQTGFAKTRNPQLRTFVVRDRTSQHLHQLNFIDTPGLMEVRRYIPSRKDPEIINLMKFFVLNKVRHLNFVGLATPAADTLLVDLNVLDSSVKFILDYLGEDYSNATSLIMTKSDRFSNAKIKALEHEIHIHPRAKNIIDFCKLGIKLFGSTNLAQLRGQCAGKECLLPELIEQVLGRVEKMRENLITSILSLANMDQPIKFIDKVIDKVDPKELQMNSKVQVRIQTQFGQPQRANPPARKNSKDLPRSLVIAPSEDLPENLNTDDELSANSGESLKEYLTEENKNLGLGNYEVWDSSRANVLLVGRAQTGKSSLVHTLFDPLLSIERQGVAATREVQYYSMIVEDQNVSRMLQLNLIDTPGLGDLAEDPNDTQSDEAILNLVRTIMFKRVNELHAVCFVSRAGETHQLDIAYFKKLQDWLGPEASRVSMIVLTHCDDVTDGHLAALREDIAKHPDSMEVYKYCKLGIRPYISVSADSLSRFDHPSAGQLIEAQLRRAERMRENLIDTFFELSTRPPPKVRIFEEIKNALEKAAIEALQKD